MNQSLPPAAGFAAAAGGKRELNVRHGVGQLPDFDVGYSPADGFLLVQVPPFRSQAFPFSAAPLFRRLSCWIQLPRGKQSATYGMSFFEVLR